ncbi:uncharacterized protein LOC118751199 [Rhagoletis pomonella]|uniref:uncharacterized protein LOC118751199 n=1 Tax=Rhagoletis pomonella TaxID=28610 RepID=UPI00177D6191|nr:uncharacterized protein LOC118751199 [Rhagoletis pomonella]
METGVYINGALATTPTCNEISINGISNGAPSSKVGWTPPSSVNANEQLCQILEQQNRQFIELFQAVQSPKSTRQGGSITLPKFNPVVLGVDAISWCSTVDVIMADNPLEGSTLIIALSKSMEGCASQWLSQISSLFHKWKSLTIEEIAIAVVLAHSSRFNNSLQRLLFKTSIKTRNELQQELRAFVFGKRKFAFENQPESKKHKPSAYLKCHFCGKVGHKIADCRLKKDKGKSSMKSCQFSGSMSAEKCRPSLICFKCGEAGHIASKCNKSSNRYSSNNKSGFEKKVDACEIIEPKEILSQSGELYLFCFDSGAECSLLKETVSEKFSGKR